MYRLWLKYRWQNCGSLQSGRFCLIAFLLLLLTACGGVYHKVESGQNLYRISRAYGVSEADIARVNNISDPTKVRSGTRLYIPGADRVRYVPVVKQPLSKQKSTTQKTSSVTRKSTQTVAKKAAPVRQKTISMPVAKSTDVKKLQWPLRGRIVRSFSAQAKAGGGKGVEIAVRSGSTVSAAEAGKVIYSGDGVNGYGHLIILQHENDLFTVYGFNQRIYARQGDFVSKGERIALSGVPPSGGVARLHFEVRKGKQAVNPILYLP
jgi:murein DD-endopeptidase MepM/ murein hydrolase activator NlpD